MENKLKLKEKITMKKQFYTIIIDTTTELGQQESVQDKIIDIIGSTISKFDSVKQEDAFDEPIKKLDGAIIVSYYCSEFAAVMVKQNVRHYCPGVCSYLTNF